MEESVNRFLLLMSEERITAPWLEGKTGIEAKRWYSIKQREVMRTSEMDAVIKLFPQYAYWLATGQEIPEAGQISPLTKKEAELLKPARQAGE
jgi:hypothetical protein